MDVLQASASVVGDLEPEVLTEDGVGQLERLGLVARDAGLRTERRLSHVFLMDVPTYPKLLMVTDAAIKDVDEVVKGKEQELMTV